MHRPRAARLLASSAALAVLATVAPMTPAFAAPPDTGRLTTGLRDFFSGRDTDPPAPPELPDTDVPADDKLAKPRNAPKAKRVEELTERRTPHSRHWRM